MRLVEGPQDLALLPEVEALDVPFQLLALPLQLRRRLLRAVVPSQAGPGGLDAWLGCCDMVGVGPVGWIGRVGKQQRTSHARKGRTSWRRRWPWTRGTRRTPCGPGRRAACACVRVWTNVWRALVMIERASICNSSSGKIIRRARRWVPVPRHGVGPSRQFII